MESTPTEAEHGVPLPLVEVGVSRLDEDKEDGDGTFVLLQVNKYLSLFPVATGSRLFRRPSKKSLR